MYAVAETYHNATRGVYPVLTHRHGNQVNERPTTTSDEFLGTS